MEEDPTSGLLWMVIVGGITTFATSCGIGANDVANSFATSVGAKTLTLRQAVVIASIFEFSGAFLMGSHVTDTVRKGIIDSTKLESDVLMLALLCVSFSTAIWLAMATWFKAPVSTTHSVIGALVGVGTVISIADNDPDIVKWDKVGKVIVSWIIAPVMAGVLSFIIFGVNKYCAFRRPDPLKKAFRIFPIMLGLTIGLNIFFIIYKGTPELELDDTPLWLGLTILFSSAIGSGTIAYVVMHQFLYEKLIRHLTKNDCNHNIQHNVSITNENIHKNRKNSINSISEIELQSLGANNIINEAVGNSIRIRRRKKIVTDLDAVFSGDENATETEYEDDNENDDDNDTDNVGYITVENVLHEHSETQNQSDEQPVYSTIQNSNTNDNTNSPVNENDISLIESPNIDNSNEILGETEQEIRLRNAKYGNIENFKNMEIYDNSVECLYSYLQVFSACMSSFAHGSNDVANSIAPFAGLYAIYQADGDVNNKSTVQLWILAMGGVGIVIGLFFWGKRIIDRMGQELGGITPTRGFAMELSSSFTVVLASRLEIPVSTTQTQTGAMIGGSLADGMKNVNWKVLGKIFLGWVLTIPAACGLAALLFMYAYYSPSS